MLKITLLILILTPFFIWAQDMNEPHAKVQIHDHVINTNPEIYDSPVFTNINLTVNPLPQNEPSVRISRITPNVVVAAWRDFRLGYSPAIRRIGYAYSTNSGSSWSAPMMLPDPTPGHATQSDPVLISDANNHFYIATTSREATNTRGETVIYKSTNLGVNWVKHSVAAASSSFEDKEWITCDLVPGSPYFNSLYITWTRIGLGIKFTKSTNGGSNWTSPVNVGDNSFGQGSNVAVGTNNNIYVVWSSSGIKFDKSTNGGTSFGTDYSLSTVTSQPTGSFPFITVDHSNRITRGNVYVVWADNRQGTGDDVWFQRSTNAGATWLSTPVRVSDATVNDQYFPTIACDTNGTLYCLYYDERLGTTQTNSWIAYSTDAGNTWINQRLSEQSFPVTYVNSDVRTGDYLHIDAFNGKVIPIWMDDRAGSPNQEIYTAYLNNIVSTGKVITEIPKDFRLEQNYPNPFNPVTNIKYDIPKDGYVKISVYNIIGEQVSIVTDEFKNAGSYTALFDASSLPSGIYLYKLESDGYTETKKMLLVK